MMWISHDFSFFSGIELIIVCGDNRDAFTFFRLISNAFSPVNCAWEFTCIDGCVDFINRWTAFAGIAIGCWIMQQVCTRFMFKISCKLINRHWKCKNESVASWKLRNRKQKTIERIQCLSALCCKLSAVLYRLVILRHVSSLKIAKHVSDARSSIAQLLGSETSAIFRFNLKFIVTLCEIDQSTTFWVIAFKPKL